MKQLWCTSRPAVDATSPLGVVHDSATLIDRQTGRERKSLGDLEPIRQTDQPLEMSRIGSATEKAKPGTARTSYRPWSSFPDH